MAKTADLDREARALLKELPRLADEINVEQAAQDDRYARRLSMYRRLIAKGVTQATIATAAKVTPMAVSYALGEARRKDEAATKKGGRAKRR